MFEKLLIANRGEIACRVARTAKQMGIPTVAVYSDIDRNALHLKRCTQSVPIGGATALESYLDAGKILHAAEQSGATAIHPGYGFLSENAEFAETCARNGITFIGPAARSIRIMGSKSAARQCMTGASVPVLAGYDGPDQSTPGLTREAGNIGFPLLIKAVSGGGGKGMRRVGNPGNFAGSLAAVQRESRSAFGDERVILEKYLDEARHIEIQVFGDQHGNWVHLFERECSLQRRNQKIIEESPAAGMPGSLRQDMTEAAIACAKAIRYVGAGTVEFLLPPDHSFYFMEMNTRLQVEHPVTEMVTGLDLVEWQIRVAAGHPLPCQQPAIPLSGHAIEARIYAESPEQGFLPTPGKVHYLEEPETNAGTRVDTGVQSGDEISVYYDPMIAKLIVWAGTRNEAISSIAKALQDYHVLGLDNNIPFLQRLIHHSAFKNGDYHTRFVENHMEELLAGSRRHFNRALMLAGSCFLLARNPPDPLPDPGHCDHWSPWKKNDLWQNGLKRTLSIVLEQGSERHTVGISNHPGGLLFHLPGENVEARLPDITAHRVTLHTAGGEFTGVMAAAGSVLFLRYRNEHYRFKHIDRRFDGPSTVDSAHSLNAPMPGSVVSISVGEGQTVMEGEPVMVIEAMKMEHQIRAPRPGKVRSIHFAEGDQVTEGQALLEIR